MATKAGLTWQLALIDIDRAGEFAGDDVDRYSGLVDLGHHASGVMIHVPTITSAAVSILAQRDSSTATVPVGVHYRQSSDNATALWATTASTGGFIIYAPLGGVRYIRIATAAANQVADRAFYVIGVL